MTATFVNVGDVYLTPPGAADPDRDRSQGMDGLREFLEAVRDAGIAAGRLRGLFHILIGRRISTTTGTVISSGITWRELSILLKAVRFDKDLVTELGADPDTLSPRDRQRMWYSAIGLAKVDSAEAIAQASSLAELLQPLGYVVGPAPTTVSPVVPSPVSTAPKPPAPSKPDDDAGKGKKKKK